MRSSDYERLRRKSRMAARALLNEYGIARIEDIRLEDIAFDRGLIVREKIIQAAEGRLVRSSSRGIITVNTAIQEAGKKRFVIAHELGHAEMHRDDHYSSCSEADFVDWHGHRPEETEANVFAAELLMPASILTDVSRGKAACMETIEFLKDQFDVTLTSAALRYVERDLAPCAVVYSQDGRVKWYRCSESFPYTYIRLGRRVDGYSGAGEYFNGQRHTTEPEMTPCNAWFDDRSLESGDRCLEQYRAMPSYNGVLSFLWMP